MSSTGSRAVAALVLAAALSGCTSSPELVESFQPAVESSNSFAAVPERAALDLSDDLALQVHFIDVGSGDCIWIHTGDDNDDTNGRLDGLNIIIDGGDAGAFGRIKAYDFISQYLIQEGRLPQTEAIDWLILTHPHSDHVGGLSGFLRDYEVRNILDPGHDKLTSSGNSAKDSPRSDYGRFFQAASDEKAPDESDAVFHWGVPDNLTLNWGDELDVDILWSSSEIVGGDMNNTSIVIRLSFTGAGNDASFMFTGDAEHFVEEHLVETLGDQLQTTVLKAGHHGSNSSSTEDFLKKVQPKHVVISSGNQSFSGTMLPRPETIQRIETNSQLHDLDTEIWRTDRGDKSPLVDVGDEGGDDTIVAITRGKVSDLQIDYVQGSGIVLDPSRCQAITKKGAQCKRKPAQGESFCWQHGDG